jgi:molybdate transport system ATP-binding protein
MTRWRFEGVTIARPGTGAVVQDLDWTLEPGRTWAIVGPVAAGKTTLAETLAGRHQITRGTLHGPRRGVTVVGFREDSRRFSYARHYYQQRFNFIEPQEDRTLDQFLGSGDEVTILCQRLGLAGLGGRSLIQLSNGQMRRARLARALMTKPDLLILDEPFIGLDTAGRAEVAELLGRLVASGQQMLLITRADEIPGWVTDVLELTAGRCTGQGPRRADELRGRASGDEDHSLTVAARSGEGPTVVELRNVQVRYGDTIILDGINWIVRTGERWAVLGPNGSGKSTLLSLLCGDHPQAYSNDVSLFGRRRGTGETIWDVKRRVGLLSPEFHLYFTEPLTAEQTAATGFHDVLTLRPITGEQRRRVRELFADLAPQLPLDRLFARLSSGEQRLVLLVRALVKAPPLLILDEPFQALDPATMIRARSWLERHLSPDQTLLFVTHHAEELPATITHRLELSAGRAVG